MDTPRNPQEAMVAAMIALGLDPLSVAQVSIQIVMLPPTFPAGPMLTDADFDALTRMPAPSDEREPTTLDELIEGDESTLDDPADE